MPDAGQETGTDTGTDGGPDATHRLTLRMAAAGGEHASDGEHAADPDLRQLLRWLREDPDLGGTEVAAETGPTMDGFLEAIIVNVMTGVAAEGIRALIGSLHSYLRNRRGQPEVSIRITVPRTSDEITITSGDLSRAELADLAGRIVRALRRGEE
jgi:hypothetical protein